MSDGDLKNRVILQTHYHCEGNMTCATVNSEAVKQLLDEAKKEFPVCKINCDIEKTQQYIKCFPLNISDEIIPSHCIKITNWFKKWFGEVNEQQT
jgi:hypothetical protein